LVDNSVILLAIFYLSFFIHDRSNFFFVFVYSI
jgi:hypothetical protein